MDGPFPVFHSATRWSGKGSVKDGSPSAWRTGMAPSKAFGITGFCIQPPPCNPRYIGFDRPQRRMDLASETGVYPIVPGISPMLGRPLAADNKWKARRNRKAAPRARRAVCCGQRSFRFPLFLLWPHAGALFFAFGAKVSMAYLSAPRRAFSKRLGMYYE